MYIKYPRVELKELKLELKVPIISLMAWEKNLQLLKLIDNNK